VREYYFAQLFNMILPSGIAGDAARAIRLRKDGDLSRATQSVVLERLTGQIAAFGLMSIGFSVVLVVPGGVVWPQWIWLILACGLAIVWLRPAWVTRNCKVALFLNHLRGILFDPRQISISGMSAVLISVSFFACAKATGTTLPFSTLFTAIPLILTAMLVPLSIGGWGWREGAAAAIFPLIGASSDAGIATGVAYGMMLLIAAIPAVILIALPYTDLKTNKTQAENT
jgi:uncharacterized membrane protein YbhN (UPF0104 family)